MGESMTEAWDGASDLAEFNTTTDGSGGAFSLRNAASASFVLGVFTNNSADDGGAIAVSGTGDLTLSSSEFVGNSGVGVGGSVFFDGGVAAITNSRFEGSSATSAGALFLRGSVGLLDGNDFLFNNSGTNGGAVVIERVADLNVRFNTLCGNSSTEQGGGIYTDRAGANGTLMWNNNVFAENSAGAEGGGLYLFGNNTASVQNNTFIGNSAVGGGAAWLEGADFRFSNNIVSTSAGDGVSADPAVAARNFELVYSSWFANTAADLGGGLSTTTLDGTNILGDPDLMWAVDSCGVATYKPNLGSPVIDAGDPNILDPDGSPSDIGAYGGVGVDPALYIDADGDGFIALNDCDDGDNTVYPGAPEACDGVDSDCDADLNDPDATGQSTFWIDADQDGFGDPAVSLSACFPPAGYVDNDADCDDTTPAITDIPPTWYTDADADGYGDDNTAIAQCTAPVGAIDVGGDCDDTNNAINPAALEICNGVDDDCDGAVDTGAVDATPFYTDLDADGFGDSASWVLECIAPPGTAANGEDCDDTNALVNPSAPEVCNSIDDDCDNIVDGANAIDAVDWFGDSDLDGWGDTGTAITQCAPPSGFVDQDGDCNDADATVYPFAPEDCTSGVDSNCDGFIGTADNDGDGVPACEDCDDGNAAINPAADEVCDGADNDCDGLVDEADAIDTTLSFLDSDGDGYGDAQSNVVSCDVPTGYVLDGTDCDDTIDFIYPGAPEDCASGLDSNCDGFVGNGDSDGDGSIACEDCDDGDPNVLPGADEICDGVDNNCDGAIDEDGATFGSPFYVDADEDGFGDPDTEAKACEQPLGWVTDGSDCDDADSTVNPDGIEIPDDGIDQDCDGVDSFTDGIAPVEDVVASGKGCGCSSSEGSAPLGALFLTGVLALRRRR